MSVLVSDPDFVLHVGDVREELAVMPDGSVDCVVTSPPYWGLRDYGTGVWEGGNPDCPHSVGGQVQDTKAPGAIVTGQRPGVDASTCRKCGAHRQDQQLGLEPTPDQYITNMVAVFREVRRVLADHGTCWVNIGDSYNANQGAGFNGQKRQDHANRNTVMPRPPGLKPKDLVGIPWKLAFALQADGWYLRADVIWAKPNPMPESVTDRPTKSHEYVFLLSKRPRYWFDQEAVREGVTGNTHSRGTKKSPPKSLTHEDSSARVKNNRSFMEATWDQVSSRNVRSVWEIPTQPYAEAHFATYPEELVRRCLLAGCPVRVCVSCGRPSERIVDVTYEKSPVHGAGSVVGRHYETGANNFDGAGMPRLNKVTETVGWSDCGHNTWRVGAVLDPFLGSGTTALVARKHGRRCVGIELNPEYAELAVRRNAQQTIWA